MIGLKSFGETLLDAFFQVSSILTTTMTALGALAVFLIALEALIDVYLRAAFAPVWSLICAAVALVMIATLLVVRLRPRLREEVRKRFHT